jgi:ribonuclease P protein component
MAGESPTANPQPRREKLPKSSRLLAKPQFNRVFDAKASAGDPHLIVHAGESPTGSARLGLAISKKAGNSPRRNRIKRVIRDVFRTHAAELPPIDLIVLARGPGTATDTPTLRDSLLKLAVKAAGRIGSRDEAAPRGRHRVSTT